MTGDALHCNFVNDADADADAEANLLTGDALHGNFVNEGPRRHITRANPMQSEARSGKKTVRQLSSGGGRTYWSSETVFLFSVLTSNSTTVIRVFHCI